MDFEWDETKCRANEAKHGVSFELAAIFLWDEAIIEPDTRKGYGGHRFLARGFAEDGIGYHIAFTMRDGRVRIITMRRFNRRDYLRYDL
jgi:uncharacterized DUF497 family protein